MGAILTLEEMNGYVRIDEIGGLRFIEEKKNVSIAVAILNCICAVLWIINLIIDFTHGYTDSLIISSQGKK